MDNINNILEQAFTDVFENYAFMFDEITATSELHATEKEYAYTTIDFQRHEIRLYRGCCDAHLMPASCGEYLRFGRR